MDTSRTEKLLGTDGVAKLKNKNVLVVGTGGVGGITAEMLVRTGVGHLTIVDFDVISSSNINRQVVALSTNVGKLKVEELSKRLLEINPQLQIKFINQKLTAENVEQIVTSDFDYVVDAIDIVKDKTALILHCLSHGISIISALGAGNKTCSPVYEVTDIFKTHNDGLAKVIRKNLREAGVKAHKVCYSCQNRDVVEGCVGSVAWHPTACACVIVSEVIKCLLKEN